MEVEERAREELERKKLHIRDVKERAEAELRLSMQRLRVSPSPHRLPNSSKKPVPPK